ncbi:MAG: hypothetical protein QXP13_06440 [Candidatus Methanomethylicia archaeon]
MNGLDKYYEVFLKSLAESDKKAINVYIQHVSKKLHKDSITFYKRASRVVLKALLLTELADKRIINILQSRQIDAGLLAKYLTLNVYVIPYNEAKGSKKQVIVKMIDELEETIKKITDKNIVEECTIFQETILLESIISKLTQRLKSAFVLVLRSTAFASSSIFLFLHNSLLGLTYPVRLLLKKIPGGSYLLTSDLFRWFIIGQSPVLKGVLIFLGILSNPTLASYATFTRSIADGTFLKKLDDAFAEFEKSLDLDSFELDTTSLD